MPTFDLHTLLREGSVSFHRRLDALPQMMRLLSPQLSIDQYLACLRGLQQAHVPLEQAVEAYLASHSQPFDFAPRRKAALIGRDIAFYSPNEDPSPRSYPASPPINDPASLVGALYVIEGATLGGRMIAARLAKSIHARPAAGADFFNVYGDQVDLRWRELWAFLNVCLTEAEAAKALATACHCFQFFEQSLSGIETPALPA